MMNITAVIAVVALSLGTIGTVRAQGYPGYPNTIMTAEPETPRHHHKTPRRAPLSPHAQEAGARQHEPERTRHTFLAHGSSGSVLPTPLPRTPLIPPEGSGIAAIHTPPAQPGPTIVPGLNPVPNLPHGSETFQDRASRCAFQQGLYNVPGNMNTQYMGACLQ